MYGLFDGKLGCSPQVYLFAEALAEGAVKMGMPSALAHSMASQTVLVSLILFAAPSAVSVAPLSWLTFHACNHLVVSSVRALGECCVIPGSIQLSCALRSAPQEEQPSLGFTPWSREA